MVKAWLERLHRGDRSTRWTGLDLGSQSIKLVELEKTPSGLRMVKHLIQELPQGSTDRIGWLQSALKEFKAQEVHLGVGGAEVALRRILLPPMPAKELPAAVRVQVKEELPFPVQEAVLEFFVQDEVWEKDVKKLDLLVAAVSKTFLQEQIDLVRRAGARVASVLPVPLALCACAKGLHPGGERASMVLIDLGTRATRVTVLREGRVQLVRDLPLGSGQLTEALLGEVSVGGGRVQIDSALAEEYKRRYGVVPENAEGATEEGVPLFHLHSLMRPVLEQLITELARFLDFYKMQSGQSGISRVLLCGGGASLKQMASVLAENLGVNVEMFNPLAAVPERAERLEAEQVAEEGPRLAVAMGLALEHGKRLSLLPPEFRQAARSETTRRFSGAAVKVGKRLALAFHAILLLWIVTQQVGLMAAGAAWSKHEPAYSRWMGLARERALLEGPALEMERFIESQPVWDGILKEIAEQIPGRVELSELSVSAGDEAAEPARFSLKGTVQGADSAQGAVARFVEGLEDSGFFDQVELAYSDNMKNPGKTSFEIEGSLE